VGISGMDHTNGFQIEAGTNHIYFSNDCDGNVGQLSNLEME